MAYDHMKIHELFSRKYCFPTIGVIVEACSQMPPLSKHLPMRAPTD